MKRLPDETFEEYKARRLAANLYVKHRLKGITFWKSGQVGTYRKEDVQTEKQKSTTGD